MTAVINTADCGRPPGVTEAVKWCVAKSLAIRRTSEFYVTHGSGSNIEDPALALIRKYTLAP